MVRAMLGLVQLELAGQVAVGLGLAGFDYLLPAGGGRRFPTRHRRQHRKGPGGVWQGLDASLEARNGPW
jgi:hypothetical protein